MAYCQNCGAEVEENAVFCSNCGSFVTAKEAPAGEVEFVSRSSGLITTTKVFLIIGLVMTAIYSFCIGLAWGLPMTIHYFNKMKKGETVGVGFKVCTLLFVSTVAGILMLCDNSY